MSLEELSHISSPAKLECLSIKGNTEIERHPDHKALLMEFFPNLKELDSMNLAKEAKQ